MKLKKEGGGGEGEEEKEIYWKDTGVSQRTRHTVWTHRGLVPHMGMYSK